MKRSLLTTSFVLGFCAQVFSQTSKPSADVRTFHLTPTAPPTPALKYELHYDLATDRLPGNAAQLYQDAILLMGSDAKDQSQKAIDAYEAHNMASFHSLADILENPRVFQELDLAARRETCDFEPPFKEMGEETLLPHLEPMVHGLAQSIEVRALRQIEQGKNEDAIKTLRLGYEMAEKVGSEPTLISALVSLHITTQMNDALIALMGRPDAPNLYFALCEFPSRQGIFLHGLYGERRFLVLSIPNLSKVFAGEELSAQQWHDLLTVTAKLNELPKLDPVKDATPKNLASARADYAERHHVTPDQASALDPVVVLGEFYVHQAEVISDDLFKWRGMPYPIALPRERKISAAMHTARAEQPGNPFLPMFEPDQTTERFAQVDRQIAALTAVEAIRSFAAANGNKLPPTLEAITETPAPADPSTGMPFEYRVEKDSAILSSSQLKYPLTYTISIRSK